jgi:hypothetical protein
MQLSTYQYSLLLGWDEPLNEELDSENTLVMVFSASDTEPLKTGFEALSCVFRRALWIGCSTAGEIYGRTLSDNTLTVAVLKFSHTTMRLAEYENTNADTSFQAGACLAEKLNAPDLKAVFVMSDGLSVNGSELAKGLTYNLPEQVVITGGLAGDGNRFQNTWVIVDKTARSHYITAVGFYGDHLGIAHGSRGGWDVLGPEREVTHAIGNILYTLDDQPALELYKKYLGDRASGLPASGLLFPLAIRNNLEIDGLTVRTILSVNETENSITFAGDIPQGALVRLMRANFERLIDGAADAATECIAADHFPSSRMLAISISCVGRRLVLGQRTEEEIDAVLGVMPADIEMIGYYSYGELSPLPSGRCDLHNQTMTLTLLWEK